MLLISRPYPETPGATMPVLEDLKREKKLHQRQPSQSLGETFVFPIWHQRPSVHDRSTSNDHATSDTDYREPLWVGRQAQFTVQLQTEYFDSPA